MSPFVRSIGAIAKLIAADLGADSVALYDYRAEEGVLCPWDSSQRRVAVPKRRAAWLAVLDGPVVLTDESQPSEIRVALLQDFSTALLVPVANERRRNTFLYVAWRKVRLDPDLSRIGGFVDGLKLIVERADQEQSVQSLIREVLRLQLELADGKIADRATGLFQGGVAERGASDLIRRHIGRVLESCEHTGVLTQRVELLKAELAARERIALAKAIVQKKHGVTEQEAYVRIQRASRRTRRNLAEVAEEVIHTEESGQRRRTA